MVENPLDSGEANSDQPPVTVRRIGPPRILLAEDDEEMRKLLIKVLSGDGYATEVCRNGVDLLARLDPFIGREAELDFNVIVSDVCMPGPLSGLEILEYLHDYQGFPPVVLITAFGDPAVHARAEAAGAVAVLNKPFGIDELLTKLHEIAPR